MCGSFPAPSGPGVARAILTKPGVLKSDFFGALPPSLELSANLRQGVSSEAAIRRETAFLVAAKGRIDRGWQKNSRLELHRRAAVSKRLTDLGICDSPGTTTDHFSGERS